MTVSPVDLHGKKILVTGPTSQVALPLIVALAPIAEVTALARFSDPQQAEQIQQLGAATIAKDLATDTLDDLPTDFDYVLHFAAVKSGDFVYDLDANAIGVGRLMARLKNVKAFLLVSTTGVYHYAGHQVLSETAPLGDNHRAMLPTYSISKIAQETVARFVAQEHGIPLTIARLSVPYADNGGWFFWHTLAMKQGQPIPVHPEQPNQYAPIHAKDYIRHIPYLLAAATPKACVVNWGGSEVVAIEEWCEYIAELTGFTPSFDLQPSAFGSLVPDTRKLQSLLGEQPITTVHWRDGVLSLLKHNKPQWLKPEYRD